LIMPTDLNSIPTRASLGYTEAYSKERLDGLRLRGDPLADAVSTELHAAEGLTNIHDLLSKVRTKAEEGDGGVFRKFLNASNTIPDWADPTKIERGQRVFASVLPFMGISLFSGSLVGGSQFRTMAVVTALAGNITSDPTRRIRETGALLSSLAFPGSLLKPGSKANDSLTRVRLLHGALRHWLPRSGRLDAHRKLVPPHVYQEGEVPLNQHDLAITLGTAAKPHPSTLAH
jgi:hypothetical protein